MMLRKVSNLFHNPSQTKEDIEKVNMYKAQVKRAEAEHSIGDIEEYLKSLELNITTYIDDIEQIPRVSQMTQKTNQFNLTTKRYTENDIENFINDDKKIVIAIGVNDKFGDNGVVGLAILNIDNDLAIIDTLLMSCRVLGRNIEYKLMDIIIELLSKQGVTKIKADYIKTLKNAQVSDLFDRYGFEVLEKTEELSRYRILINNYKNKNLDYIGVTNGK
jgi:FkbH-like protein